MSIDKRGDNSWRFRVKYKRKLYSMNFQGTEKEAEKAHMIFKADVTAGRISLTKNITMNKLAETVYNEYVIPNLRPHTRCVYKTYYNKHILPEFGIMDIQDIKPIHIQKFVNSLGKKLEPNTVGGVIGCLGKTFGLAEKWGMIEQTPCKNIEYIKAPKANHNQLLSIDEMKLLSDYYEHDEQNLMHKAAFYLAIGCGLRNSEIRALTTKDIDFENGIINIDKQIGLTENEKGELVNAPTCTKTPSSIRKIYAPKFVLDSLKKYIEDLPYIPISKQIFISHVTRKPITKQCLSYHFRNVVKILGITPIRFHDLRHLQATLLINSGANIQSVSKRLGHSNLKTTLETYTHSIEAVDKKVADTFEETFKNLNSLS